MGPHFHADAGTRGLFVGIPGTIREPRIPILNPETTNGISGQIH